MAIDLSIFDRIKTPSDYARMEEEFNARKRARQQQQQMGDLEIQKMQRDLATGGTSNDPASVREYNFYNNLPPEEQQRYLQMKRADQVLNLGGTMAVRNPMGGIQEQYPVTPKITETPEYMANQSGAQESAKINAQMGGLPQLDAERERQKILAQEQAKAQAALEQTQENSRQMLDLIDSIENDQGLSAVVGMPNPMQGGFGLFNIAGTPAADFRAKLDQLGGKQFLEAFESLKGGGQITEIEGEKATNAIARMQTSQSEQAFKQALSELRDIVVRASERAAQKADPMQASQQAVRQRQQEIGSNPYQTQAAPKKGDRDGDYIYMGGDPANSANWKKIR